MDKLTDLFLDGNIDKETHEEKREQLIKKREEVLRKIDNHNKLLKDLDQLSRTGLHST